jgi:2'-5' RNA ligase
MCNAPTPKKQKKVKAMHHHRLQLTLFVPPQQAAGIEAIRQTVNPVQYALIQSHVTLCREDELEPLDTILRNLQQLKHPPITIGFGPPIRFAEGEGILLPAIEGLQSFQKLRKAILKGITENPRVHEAHITLLHPRNATCTDAIFAQIQQTSLPMQIQFDTISLIEQLDGRAWTVLEQFSLGSS